jgi:hypothetical protein
MSETSFTTRHYGGNVVCTKDATIVHLFDHVASTIDVCEGPSGPEAVKVVKDATTVGAHEAGLTMVYLDWRTACEIAEAVSRRLEQAEHEPYVCPLHLV